MSQCRSDFVFLTLVWTAFRTNFLYNELFFRLPCTVVRYRDVWLYLRLTSNFSTDFLVDICSTILLCIIAFGPLNQPMPILRNAWCMVQYGWRIFLEHRQFGAGKIFVFYKMNCWRQSHIFSKNCGYARVVRHCTVPQKDILYDCTNFGPTSNKKSKPWLQCNFSGMISGPHVHVYWLSDNWRTRVFPLTNERSITSMFFLQILCPLPKCEMSPRMLEIICVIQFYLYRFQCNLTRGSLRPSSSLPHYPASNGIKYSQLQSWLQILCSQSDSRVLTNN